ncbi:MAG: hypothetical protein ACOY9Y_07185 [Bacillota bacterium]
MMVTHSKSSLDKCVVCTDGIQAQRLIIAALSGDEKAVKKALRDIRYIMKHNFSAYQSHRKSRLQLLR